MNLDKFKSKQGHFIETIDGKHVFKIGKYKGITVEKVYEDDDSYVEWAYNTSDSEFDHDAILSITSF